MTPAPRRRAWSILALACALTAPGCNQFGSRQRLEESHRYIQALRSENDQLKDQLLTYRNQYDDLSERSVDDNRRAVAQVETIEGLRRSVHAYQTQQDELKTAFRELRDSLPTAVRSVLAEKGSRVALDADRDPIDEETPPPAEPPTRTERRKPLPTEMEATRRRTDGWAPASSKRLSDEPGLDPSP
ncbi:hypothetical protein [Paludisphaera rhizosphaerae]|uniref:hypothetical protein n=1 Tax=Paludisphaera rhizosphaerae TaxID=2711216 RepID=UPI0013EC30E6|nr:hypothetical protein [Paludisphaera rhizosphaerae]